VLVETGGIVDGAERVGGDGDARAWVSTGAEVPVIDGLGSVMDWSDDTELRAVSSLSKQRQEMDGSL